MFNDEQLNRYSRQLMVDELDLDGQEALAAARVLIVGLSLIHISEPTRPY